MKILKALVLSLPLASFASGFAFAADFSDPTWPCIQRKVPNLSIGQMWTGPLMPETAQPSAEILALGGRIAVRRTTVEAAGEMIDTFAADLGEGKNDALAMLFTDIFQRINTERSSVIAGIARYAGRQTSLSERIDEQRDAIVALEAKTDKTDDEWDKLEEMQDILVWDERIYRERAQSLTYVCETPVLLEKRAFALARKMAEHLE